MGTCPWALTFLSPVEMALDGRTADRVVWTKAHFASRGSKIGSGFRLDGEKVLTARHVVHDDEVDPPQSASRIQVFPKGISAKDEASERFEASLIWSGNGRSQGVGPGVDAALLEVARPVEIGRFDQLVEEVGDFKKWKSIGFPTNTTDFQNAREPTSIQGEFEIANFERGEIPLRYLGGPPKPQKGSASWAGISGGPVFLRDSGRDGHLCGVLTLAKKDHGDRLILVSMWSILDAPGFREAAGLPEPARLPEMPEAWTRVLDILKESTIKDLLRRFDAGWNPELLDDEGLESFLYDLLGRDRIGFALRHLDELAREASNAETLEKLKNLGLDLYALKAHLEVVADEEARISTTQCRLPTLGIRDTEGALAAHSDVRPSFRPGEPRSRPVPEHGVPAPSLLGSIDTRVEAWDTFEEVAARVKSYSTPEERIRGFIRHDLDRYPYLLVDEARDFAKDDTDAGLRRRARTIDANLAEELRLSGRQKYVVFRPTDESEIQRTDAQMKLLADWLKQLQTVRIRHDPDKEVEIENDAKPLWTLLRRQPKSSS